MILSHRPVPFEPNQGFGANATQNRPDPVYGNYQPVGHLAVDFGCPEGTPIVAAAPGTVVYAGWGQHMPEHIAVKYGYLFGPEGWASGRIVIIDHGDGSATAYSHQSELHVTTGQRVNGGHRLGSAGTTGRSTGPHLHFEYMTLPINYSSAYYSRSDPMKQFGSASIMPTGATAAPKEEEIVPNQSDRVFDDITGSKVSLNELLNSIDRKQDQQGTVLVQLATALEQNMKLTAGILTTRIADPSDPKKSYTIADYIVGGATNAKYAAGNSGKALENTAPEALAKAVREGAAAVSASDIADQLSITIKEK